MNKAISVVNEIFAGITYHAAVRGAGLMSLFGWHQPKVPEKLAK